MQESDEFDFADAPKAIRKAYPEIPDISKVVRQTYQSAEPIDFSKRGERPVLYIVESGVAEIYQLSTCFADFHAYRPIKVFRTGQAFGLFTVADALTGRPGPSRPKETWHVQAGKVSALLLDCIDAAFWGQNPWKGKKHDGAPSDTFRPHDLLRRQKESAQAVILRVSLPPLNLLQRDHPDIVNRVIRASWHDVFEYRIGKNIYNAAYYVSLRKSVYSHQRYIEIAKTQKVAVRKFKYKVLDYYIDAIVDALDRPTYDAPMFSEAGLTERIDYQDHNNDDARIDLSQLLDADHVSQLGDSFYYPIGLLNYGLNCHFAQVGGDKKEITEALAPRHIRANPWLLEEVFEITKEVYFAGHSHQFNEDYAFDVSLVLNRRADWNAEAGRSPYRALLLEFRRR